jgi:hypothetical protein
MALYTFINNHDHVQIHHLPIPPLILRRPLGLYSASAGQPLYVGEDIKLAKLVYGVAQPSRYACRRTRRCKSPRVRKSSSDPSCITRWTVSTVIGKSTRDRKVDMAADESYGHTHSRNAHSPSSNRTPLMTNRPNPISPLRGCELKTSVQ